MPLKYTRKHSVNVWIKPPSVQENDWKFSKDATERGLFVFGVAWLDIQAPWVPTKGATFGASQTTKWWQQMEGGQLPAWLFEWGDDTKKTTEAVKYGPWVLKWLPPDTCIQVACKYTSYWQFGGEILPHENIADPKNPQVASARWRPFWDVPRPDNPLHPTKNIITERDLNSGGELRPRALIRLRQTTDSDYTTVSESDRSDADSFCHRRTSSTSPSPKKAKKKKTKRPKTETKDSTPRVPSLSIDLFLEHVRKQLGRELTFQEQVMVVKSMKKPKHDPTTLLQAAKKKTPASATRASAGSSTWSLCC